MNNEYESLRLYPEESTPITILKGIIGALIGAIPGMALWIIVGKLGYVASICGAVLAVGIIAGYIFMTKKKELSPVVGIVICAVIMLLVLILTQKIVWSWKLAETFQEVLPQWKELFLTELKSLGTELSDAELNELLTDDFYKDALEETFGFSEGTFSECFSHFGDLLEKLDVKKDFYWSVGKSAIFAFIGGAASFAKLT